MCFLKSALSTGIALISFAHTPMMAEEFIAPSSGNLYIRFVRGDAGAVTSFGVGTSPQGFVQLLSGLPAQPSTSNEVLVGTVTVGQALHVGMQTEWLGQTHWAFSNASDQPSLTTFSDKDNSLQRGGNHIEQTAPNEWLMHLDNAASFLVDDDDNDLLLRLRLDPQPLNTPTLISLTPTTGTGSASEFTAVFSHTGGVNEFYLGYVLFLPTPNIVWFTAQQSCLIEFNRLGGAFDGKGGMRLISDSGESWLGPVQGIALSASAGSLGNSRCTVDIGRSRAVISGNTVTLTVSVAFTESMSGLLGTFAQAFDVRGAYTDMRQFGDWTVLGGTSKPGPSVDGLIPGSGSGSSATFVATASHAGGLNQLGMITMLIADKIVGGAPCQVFFFPLTNTVNLVNDAGTAMVSPSGITPGTGTLTNSRCSVNGTSMARINAGNSVSLVLPVAFNVGTFSGAKSVYVNAFDVFGGLTHWVTKGIWHVQ